MIYSLAPLVRRSAALAGAASSVYLVLHIKLYNFYPCQGLYFYLKKKI